MDTNKLLKCLQSAEENLRESIGLAAQAGSYSLAQSLSAIAGDLEKATRSLPETDQAAPQNQQMQPTNALEKVSVVKTKKSKASGRSKRSSRSKKARGYPKYQFTDNTLIRIGWSKKTREEYSHKVPRSSYESVADAIDSLISEGKKTFVADDVASALVTFDHEHVPSYQMYIVIGYLKDCKVLDSESRGSYTAEQSICDLANSAWGQITSS